jgi:putative Ca2+/H+ antiporter (TMEM165/GDT1 family)
MERCLLFIVVLAELEKFMEPLLISTGAVALAAHFAAPWAVVAGTTLGMLIADVPAVFLGDKLAGRISTTRVHTIAASIFAALGIATLISFGNSLMPY